MTSRKHIGKFGAYLALITASGFSIFPLFWMFASSLKSSSELFKFPAVWLPAVPQWENYTALFTELSFGTYLLNSFLVAGATTFLSLLLSSMAGYALAKFHFVGKSVAFWFVMITLLLPFQAAVVPLYLVVRDLNMLDSLWALIVPFATTPFGIFLMRQYMLSIPDEVVEAARVDGAGELRIFFVIILPMCVPALSALAIFGFMSIWNAFLWPIVALQSEEFFTIPVGIALMQGEFSTAFHQLMAAASLASLPMLVLYLFLQRNFVNAMMTSGLKG